MTAELGNTGRYNFESERNDPSTFVVDRFRRGKSVLFRSTTMCWEEFAGDAPQLVQQMFECDDLETLLKEVKARSKAELLPVFATTLPKSTHKPEVIIHDEWPPREQTEPKPDKPLPFTLSEVEYWTHFYESGHHPLVADRGFTRIRSVAKRFLTDIHRAPVPSSSLHRHHCGILDPSAVR